MMSWIDTLRTSAEDFGTLAENDPPTLFERMLRPTGVDTVRITEVKGHADEGMVLDGRVRELDRVGNDAADEAADFGRRRVGDAVIDACRNLSGVCCRWLLFLTFIGSSLPFLELWSIIMVGMVLLLIL